MSDANSRVVAMIERALKKDAQLKSTDLQERAAKMDKSVGELSGRQFHARYVIQVRKRLFGRARRKKPARRPRTSTRPSSAGDAALSFAQAAFEEKKAELAAAMDEAYRRALAADSVKKIDALLVSLDQHAEEIARL